MARKKADFSALKEQAAQVMEDQVFTQISKGTTATRKQTEATPEDIKERREKGNTQGRKGAKRDRMNMAFSPDNYEFVRVMARATGKTMTGFINSILDKYRETHQKQYLAAKEFWSKMEIDED